MSEFLEGNSQLHLNLNPPDKVTKFTRASQNSRYSEPKNPANIPMVNDSPYNSNSDGGDNDDDEEFSGLEAGFSSPIQDFLRASECALDNNSDPKSLQNTDENQANSTPHAKNYSMEPDMIFGWKPKFVSQMPVPLKFFSPMVDELVEKFSKTNQSGSFPELIYQGFRPDNSFLLHERFSSPETYNMKISPFLQAKLSVFNKLQGNSPLNPPRPFLGMKPNVGNDCLVFDSIFEQGNLDTVIRKSVNEYDLFERVDSNTKGHTSWYYFTVKNMKKGQRVKFNLVNLSKKDSLYQRGMKPYVQSKKLLQEKDIDWQQNGENVSYGPSNIAYPVEDFEEHTTTKKYYKLTFEYEFEYDDDVVSFALCVPYTYTRLLQTIQGLIDIQKANDDFYVTTSKLCVSLGGVTIPLLTVTDPDESEFPMKKRPYIIMVGRVHPGESNASWMIDGFMKEICEKENPEAQYLRKRYIFKIIPMLNPDGVILGNHRTGFCGNDLNRKFVHPKEVLHPSIVGMKELVREIIGNNKEVFAYIDFHGHSLKKNVFTYGAEFPVYDPNYYRVKILPKLLSKRTSMFRFQSCTFTISKPKLTTARAVFSTQYGISHFYTLEASYSGYMNNKREMVAYDSKGFQEMGIAIVGSLWDYRKIIDEEERIAASLKMKREDMIKMQYGNRENEQMIDKMSQKLKLGGGSSMNKSLMDNSTPKYGYGQEGDKKKSSGSANKKFRIRKAKPIIELDTNPTLTIDNASDFVGIKGKGIGSGSDSRIISSKFSKSFREDSSMVSRSDSQSFLGGGKESKTSRHDIDGGINIKLGFFSLIDEIDRDASIINPEDRAESDAFSEGGSDSESSEDDFSAEEMKRLQKNMVGQLNRFKDICTNEKFDPKKKLKVMTPKVVNNNNKSKTKNKDFGVPVNSQRQSILHIQNAAERSTSRSVQVQKRGEISAREKVPQFKKIAAPPKEIQFDNFSNGTTIAQIKNQVSGIYMGTSSAPNKKSRFIMSANPRNVADSRGGNDTPLFKTKGTEDFPGKNDGFPETIIKKEAVKPIHMNSLMDKRYQVQRSLKSPLDRLLMTKPKPFLVFPEKSENKEKEKDDFESVKFDPAVNVNVFLDKGFRTSLGFGKGMLKGQQNVTDKEGFYEIDDGYPNFAYKRESVSVNPNSYSIDFQSRIEQHQQQMMERNASRDRLKYGGGFQNAQMVVATAQVYTTPLNDNGLGGVAPLKKDRKLPIAYETYKKMLHLRRRTEEIREKKFKG